MIQKAMATLMLAVTSFTAPVAAEEWPSDSVSIVVPYNAGGITDVLARVVAEELSKRTGKSVIVENRAGAGGNIGAAHVAQAEPDGTTLFVGAPGPFSINEYMFSEMPYSPEKDLRGITVIAQVPIVVMVNTKRNNFKTIDDLLAYANANPGKLSSSSGGVGQSSHLSLELFKSISGVDIVHVPYNGAAPSRMDLAAGRVDMTIDNLSTYLPDIEAGTLAVLASGTPQRSKFLPDVPTLREVGLEDYSATAWYALAAPAATPDETINQIYAKVDEILSDPEVVARIDALRAEVVDGTPAETDAFFAEEREKWSAVIERAGIGAQ
ncbi:MAG: tripartite tricarboxylate transporter substrate binding protein [Rhizobiaceae bacterium]|nr:tripartite tricarboxylate transporter substrate binding protein [Rhizobiaceae bacterium]